MGWGQRLMGMEIEIEVEMAGDGDGDRDGDGDGDGDGLDGLRCLVVFMLTRVPVG